MKVIYSILHRGGVKRFGVLLLILCVFAGGVFFGNIKPFPTAYADSYINAETDVWQTSDNGAVCYINYTGKYSIEVGGGQNTNSRGQGLMGGGRILAYIQLKQGDIVKAHAFSGGAYHHHNERSAGVDVAIGYAGGDAYLISVNGTYIIGAGGGGGGGWSKNSGADGRAVTKIDNANFSAGASGSGYHQGWGGQDCK